MIWFVIPFMLVVLTLVLLRTRKGGPGLNVGAQYVPQRFRAGMNERSRKHGWSPPSDTDGDADPDGR